ncbi:unnamed protein product [Microthlaspi erraticum]|uniref:CCHC-type domain-containing protein n=1 Tax=Microthlaspi erraticum TaxID=1685480 RepID=A0A6D2JPS6_9BRAS|nr:unnamed protein product [Microthlaspi erraticum]
MPKRSDEKIVFDDGEDEDIADPIAIRAGSDEEESEDDEEANEDLSLKILEKALSRRDSDDSKETSMSELNGSGVVSTVMVNGEKSKGNNKLKKRTNLEDEEISIAAKDKDVENMVEDSIKREEVDDEAEKSAEPSSNLVLKKLLRGARYFDPPDAGWLSCYSCGEQGHATVNCPTPTKRRKPCFICGSLEHGAKQCSKGHDCYICKNSGHRARDCPDKYKSGAKTAVCLRCGDFGHDMILCKYEYSRDDLKDIQCYVCKRFGHLCCVEPGDSPTWAVSCYRCGQLGHIGLACGRYYEESTEKDSASSCFKCGEEGHFSRECPNSLSISNSQGRDSPNLCYRCFGEGHFARECPNPSSQVSKRNRETSTPSLKSHKRFKEALEYNSTPHVSNGKKKKKNNRENSEHYSTPHESNGKMKKKKNVENSEHNSTPHESNRKKKKKNIENSEHNSTPHESNGKMKKKNKENAEHNANPHESNEKSKKKKKKGLKGDQPQISPHKSNQRGGWITEEPEEDYFQRETIRRPRSPITPSGHYHHRSPITPSGHYHHRSAITPSDHYHHRTPTFNSGGHYQDTHSTTPYGRNHRVSSFESYEHRSAHPPPTWQRDYPPTSSHHHHHHQQHHQHNRYAPAPSRYGPAHRYGDFSGNYDRW